MVNPIKMREEANSPWDTILPKIKEAREKGELKITLDKDELSSLRNLPQQGKQTPMPDTDWADASIRQVGGSHYKDMAIQPMEFCYANKLGNVESEVITYVCRWRKKGGIQDLEKAIHSLQMLIELESKYA